MADFESILSVKDAVHKLQLSLLDGIRNEKQLTAAGSLMSRSDYEDVVTERSISNVCGYPLCNNPLPSERSRKGRYRISLKEHKVYDLHETYLYCSTACVVNSRTFAESLDPERSSVSNPAKINEVLKLFGDFGLEGKDVSKKGILGVTDLKIEEKLDVKMGQMSLDEWIGPSNAIEGYVPVIDRSSKPSSSSKYQKNELKLERARAKTEKGKLVDDLDFLSTIIVGDQFSVPELSSDSKFKSNISVLEESKIAQIINLEASTVPVENSAELSSLALGSQFGIPEMVYDLNESISNRAENVSDSGAKKSKKKVCVEKKSQSNEARAEYVSDRGAKESKKEVIVEKKSQSNEARAENVSSRGAKESKKKVVVEKTSQSSLKSSIKGSGPKKTMRSVTWADESKTCSTFDGKLCKVQEVVDARETAETSSSSDGDNGDGSIRFESAEACALALSQAAEAVASGEADVTEAVSEAGILILPQPNDVARYSQEDEDTTETDLVPLRWPKKHGVLNSAVFSTEDSWYESPPEGFSLTLSSFATMYMALFSWMTCSSLAYIYGQDESSQEEFLFANGREYPRKVVLSDGRSSEIKLAMGGCLSRAIPKVVTDLRLKTPIFAIEKEVGHLLNTMSFTDAIPSFRLKQWHVIALLFVDALSVCRIPGLAQHMISGRIFLQKILDGAQISGEEYATMKDLLIPLGRVPQFSAQSGA